MPACPVRVRRRLERWGFDVLVVDVGEFRKAGGAVRCLTLALDLPPSALSRSAWPDARGRPVRRRGAAPPRRGLRRLSALRPARAARSRPSAAAPSDPVEEKPSRAGPIELAERHCARNYAPLPIVVARAQGAWVYDCEGRPYLDALAAYSALNFGHRHPDLVAAARRQLERVTLTSRAFQDDQLGPFCRDLAELCGKDLVLPMNTGAEAVETAIKAVRRWGYEVKAVAPDRARIVACEANFHGRTVTIVSFSDDPLARRGFGPYTPGFEHVPHGDLEALRSALRDDVVAFLVEPIQGEAGVVLPPDGYLRAARQLCHERGVLLVADEIQSGLGRTGRTFACDHEGVEPDVYVLGKPIGGGIVPLSAVVADEAVLGLLRPGEHGSTFGGNPLACAVGREVVRLLATGHYQDRAARLGARLLEALGDAALPGVEEIRGRGLWVGIDLARDAPSPRAVCERLLSEGVLAKDTHERTIRLAPPLVVTEDEVDFLRGAPRARARGRGRRRRLRRRGR